MVYNKSACGSVGWWLSAKPSGLTFGWFVWAESADSAAHSKHYRKFNFKEKKGR
jgi:hypothetical protein